MKPYYITATLFAVLMVLQTVPAFTISLADTLTLPSLEITAERFELPQRALPVRVLQLEPADMAGVTALTAGSLLQRTSAVNVRGYGPGLAQTVSLQGFSGSQLKVMWDDIPLNNPMLGLADLSLYPAVMIDRVDVNAHQGSAEYGAHAIGGVIQLQQIRSSKATQLIGFQTNSTASNSVQFRVQQPLGNWYFDFGAVNQYAPNSFDYDDITQNPIVRRSRQNADKRMLSGVFHAAYVNSNFTNESRLWLTDSESGIPGSIVSLSPNARQADRMFRFSNRSTYAVTPGLLLTFAGTYSRHDLDFTDPDTNIISLSTSETAGVRIATRYRFSKYHQIRLISGINRSEVSFTEYNAPVRNHAFIQTNYVQQIEVLNLFVHPSVRVDYYSDFSSAITAGLGFVRPLDILDARIYANANRNFAPPTFNDLYWPMLGNELLVPETSWKLDIGGELTAFAVPLVVQFFYNSIQNGIQWLPSSQDGRFRPANIRAIESFGVNVGSGLAISTGPISNRITWQYTFLDARYTSERFAGDRAKGNQLVYQPRHRGVASWQSSYRKAFILLNWNYTDERSVTEDRSFTLQAHHTLDFTIAAKHAFRLFEIHIQTTAENLFNSRYEQIRFYPMPGRVYHLSITLKRN